MVTAEGEKPIEFSQIKTKIENIVDEVIQKKFNNVKYEGGKMQRLVNESSEAVTTEC